ncbi:DUF998 domain-containing protein [Streptomyces antibioticus]|uniref:DUF998 domain-containing protein n=1 Tax=Streptomyces antibioticus TaxID=1890 RepID=A0AAE6YC59_STRAT|nr:DUF998 domain-containing protein [Streptomyces antibioticus]OOQ47064.1 hypothetical protein AFM16_30240 [Streptomyces antibioticus]QIT47370.1 DUF998 domain-containing protein [Streptomyces antibioticus]
MTDTAPTATRGSVLAEAAIWPAFMIVAVLHALPTGLNPLTDMVSEYALGRYSTLTKACFLAIAVSAYCLAVGLRSALPPVRAVKTATTALTVMAAATAALPFFAADPDRPSTPHGWVHLAAALLGMVSLIVAAFAVAAHTRSHSASRPSSALLTRLGFACAAVMSVSLVLMLARVFPGLTERVLILAGMVWIGAVARSLRH